MNSKLQRMLGCAALLAFAVAPLAARADETPRSLVAKAETTFANFQKDPDMEWFQRDVGKARAVLIAPEIVKAGFIIGGAGGRAVLFARDTQTGEWRGPVFYSMATPSIGFQAGIQVSENVTLVMTEKALSRLLSDSVKIGADVSVAAGNVGQGAQSNVQADMITYVRSKGLYGGLNLDGSVVSVSDKWNARYYGRKVSPADVLVRGTVASEHGGHLRAMLPAAPVEKQ